MSNWKIKEEDKGDVDLLATAVNVGSGLAILDFLTGDDPVIREANTYTIENEETGEEKEVTARSLKQLGEKIANGEFDDEDAD